MTRRTVLRRLLIAALGVGLMRVLPGIAPDMPTVAFDPTAFVRVFEPLDHTSPCRFDVIFGWGVVNPDYAITLKTGA